MKRTAVIVLWTVIFTIFSNPETARGQMNVPVKKEAKAYATASITIDAPAERVYAILADINKWPNWQSSVEKAEMEGPAAEGKKFKWKADGLKIKSKLHTVHPASEFGWTGRIWWITAVHNWTFEEKGGKTTVTVEESLSGFLSGTFGKSLAEGLQKNLEELKAAAEG
jgi:uncharacterized protein YndB with AHSA1/START domain